MRGDPCADGRSLSFVLGASLHCTKASGVVPWAEARDGKEAESVLQRTRHPGWAPGKPRLAVEEEVVLVLGGVERRWATLILFSG